MMTNFEKLLLNAKADDEKAIHELLKMYNPLIKSLSHIDKIYDEELYQILLIKFWISIKIFKI